MQSAESAEERHAEYAEAVLRKSLRRSACTPLRTPLNLTNQASFKFQCVAGQVDALLTKDPVSFSEATILCHANPHPITHVCVVF